MTARLELAAITMYKAWREMQMAEIKKREDALTAKLRAVVPESFNVWIEEESSVIPNLIEYGAASRKYRRGDAEGHTYGYTDLEEFERRFEELKTVWAGVVNISISWDGNFRFEATFTIV